MGPPTGDAASEDEILKDLDKLEGRMFSVEKTVGMRTPAGEWNLNPAAQPPDRASSSGFQGVKPEAREGSS